MKNRGIAPAYPEIKDGIFCYTLMYNGKIGSMRKEFFFTQ